MPLSPGEAVQSGEISEGRPQGNTVSPGDAVTIVNREAVPADETDDFGGIAGESERTILSGTVLANVHTDDPDGAVIDGSLLSLSPEAGALYRDYETDVDGNVTGYNPGPVLALSDEGGTWHSEEGTYDVPAGYAVVHL